MASRLLAHLRLLRLPLAATTVADIWVGYMVVRSSRGPLGADAPAHDPAQLLALHAAALCFYGAGMTLNDAFDADRDMALHPERPIPSGVIPRRAAFAQGALLLAVGIGIGAVLGGGWLLAAALLGVGITLYNAVLKRWVVPGAVGMGLIRYLDIQLGAGFAAGVGLVPAMVLGFYVAGVTYLSTVEERPGDGRAITLGMGFTVFALMAGGLRLPRFILASWLYALAASVCCFMGMRATHLRTRRSVQQLVLACLLGMFAVNGGSLLGYGLWPWALACVGLAGTFPLLARLQGRLARASMPADNVGVGGGSSTSASTRENATAVASDASGTGAGEEGETDG
jgi:4-hydroxybenzoate polyprenyltransferase